ncbi:MAG: hypothetical protein U0K53_01680 [Paludibacteraceae bacterium]|nr:hypothetical protein [Paludibacteraceae bacterium]
MIGNLNIYKISGVGQSGITDKARVWLANTNDLENTIAMNSMLASLNCLVSELEITDYEPKQLELMNQIDIHTVVLDALILSRDNKLYSIDLLRDIISNMILTDSFVCESTDIEKRNANLDALLVKFSDMLNSGITNYQTDAIFNNWFDTEIIAKNYNDVPQNVVKRYNQILTNEAVGDTEPQKMTDKLSASGPNFLYLFFTDDQKQRCNKLILARLEQEYKNIDWIVKNCRGFYDKDAVIKWLRNGIIKHYGMTPEQKIEQLIEYNDTNKANKIGDPVTAIISAVAALIGLLISLYYMIIDIYQVTYEVTPDYEYGTPDQEADGWEAGDAFNNSSILGNSTNNSISNSNTMIYLGIGAAALLLLSNQ